jgi:DNA-binding SARP family transcriptional activator
VKVRVLGPLEVRSAAGPLVLGTPKQRTVLALLLARAGAVVPVDELIAELWWDEPPPSATANVRMYANNLRRLLASGPGEPGQDRPDQDGAEPRHPPDPLARVADGYRLSLDGADFDLARFRALAEQGRRALAAGDLATAASRLDGAVELWRGAPAAGVPAGRVLAAWRVTVWEERLRAVEDLADALLGMGAHERVSGRIGEVLVAEPLRERAHTLLVRARYQAGDVAGALAAVQAARRILAEELGVEPGEELSRLHKAVLNREPDPAVPSGGAIAGGGPGGGGPAAPRQLPADVPGFAGRAAQLRQLDAALAETEGDRPGAVVISAIAGTAGIGKTALAVHWAHRVADRFPDGQLYLNLRGFDPGGAPMPATEAVRGLLHALGVPADRVPSQPDAQAGLFRSLLAGRRMLVLLDNARDAEQVRPLLPGSPGCLALVTSRNQLTSLVATAGAHPLTLDLLPAAEARDLLARRLGAARVAAEPAAADAVITACARLPLALAIAAARARETGAPLAEIAAELDASRHDAGSRLDALDAGDPVSQVRAVFSWSYTALAGSAARVFRLLGLHPGPDLSVPAAASLAGEPLGPTQRALADLSRANLLTEHVRGRYTFHDLLRAYAADLAHEHDDDDARRAALTRLLDHYAHTAVAADRLMTPRRDPIPLPLDPCAAGARPEPLADVQRATTWLTAEHQVLFAALRLAAEDGFDARSWQLAWSLNTFLDQRGHWLDMADAWRTALRAAERLGHPAATAHAHRWLAGAAMLLDHRVDALANYRRALDIYGQLGDLVGQSDVHRHLGLLRERQGQLGPALDHVQRALVLSRAAGSRRGEALALNGVGWCHTLLDDHAHALVCCGWALTLLQELGERPGQAATWDSLGYAHHHLGQYVRAADCYRESLALLRDMGDRHAEATVLTHLGETHRAAGDASAAGQVWRDALGILNDLRHRDADTVRTHLSTIT